jgi:hypothetical protein
MPRVSKSAALLLALLLSTTGIATVTALTIISTERYAHPGDTVPVTVAFAGSNHTVYLFAGTADGSTEVTIGDRPVTIPVAGIVFEAGSQDLPGGKSVTIDAAIPDDDALIGARVRWVAIVVDNATGQVIAIARSGGPIIEDAIC